MQTNSQTYKATNVGGLMIEDSIKVFLFLYENGTSEISQQQIEDILPIKSKSSRKRIFSEIRKRYEQLEPKVLEYFVTANKKDKKVILFYACMKLYKLLNDIVFEILIPKYEAYDTAVTRADITALIDRKKTEQPKTDKWSVRTRNNMAGIMLMMLKEVGLQKENLITPLQANKKLWKTFVKAGEPQMLNAALLPNREKRNIFNI